MIDFQSLKEKAIELKDSRLSNTTHTSNGIYSVAIVNNKNGKRLSFSKTLSVKLGLQDTVDIVVLEDEGVILIGKALPYKVKSTYVLRGDDKKIVYNSELVHSLTKIFNLDFSSKTSCAFSDITINADDNVKMGAVKLTPPPKDA